MPREKELQEMRQLEEYVKALRKDMDSRLGELKEQMKTAQEKAAKTVIERPVLALGVAFVAGIAVGIALSSSRD